MAHSRTKIPQPTHAKESQPIGCCAATIAIGLFKKENGYIVENTEPDEEEAIATMDGQLLSSLVGVVF
jgi:hypothetical protein